MNRSVVTIAVVVTAIAASPVAIAAAHHKPGHTGGPPAWAGTPGGPHGIPGGETGAPGADHDPPVAQPPAGGSGDETGGGSTFAAPPPPGVPGHSSGNPQKCKKPQRVGFVVIGAFDTYAEPELSVSVTAANRHARRYLETYPPTFDISAAEIAFGAVDDVDGNGTVGFEDAVVTDTVELGGKLVRPKPGCTGETALRIDRVKLT